MPRPSQRRRPGFTLVELSIVVLIIGIISALAVTEFVGFMARSKRAEVLTNLRAIGRLEQIYQQDNRTFSPYLQEIGFAPERHNRYAYVLQHGCPAFQDRSAANVALTPAQTCVGVDTFVFQGAVAVPPTTLPEEASESILLVTAVANLDTDAELDQWSLTSEGRPEGALSSDATCATGEASPYEPCQDLSDS